MSYCSDLSDLEESTSMSKRLGQRRDVTSGFFEVSKNYDIQSKICVSSGVYKNMLTE